ncbi:MAG: hypothetical protein WC616_02385 [Candidatus Omnitrophota bacterium]
MPFGQYVTNNAPYSSKSVERQIGNAERRIRSAGYKPESTDRNWFEKLTNLPKNQNAFLDVLELLNRPTQGIMNVGVADTGQNPATEFWHGFSGKDRTRGVDLARKSGVTNKVGQFALGTALEIVLDPLNFVPAGAVGKLGGKVGRGAGKALDVASDAVPFVRRGREIIEPAVTATKEALGKVFVPQYGWERTLTGEADETLKKGFLQSRRATRVQTEKSMAGVADIAKQTGIEAGEDVGRVMEAPLKAFDEMGKPIVRPIRELSTNENVQKAAQDLGRNNELIRQWALDEGININELEGYMTHILSSEERKLRGKPSIRGASGAGAPNKKILNARKLQGSAEEVNEQVGRKLFEPNAYFATAIGQKRLIEYVNAVKFRREVLSNPKFAVPFAKGDIVPADAVKISSAEYKFIKDATLDNLDLADEIGGEYIVTKGAKEALDRYKKLTTDEGVNSFLKVFDSAQSVWKRAVLFSIPYHLRNDMGAKFNNWVAGMNAADLMKYSATADDEVFNAIIKNNPSSLYKEYIEQGLGASSLSKIEFRPYGEPEEAIKKTVALRSKTTAGQVKERLNPLRAFETSREFGDFVDQTNRFALYKWAKEAKKLSPEQARELVNRVQFDYTNLTTAEQEIFARMFPFYRWMRNNIPYQLRQFVNDPKKYMRVNKLRLNAQEAAGIDEENMPEWMKEQFAIAVSGGKGKGKFLSMSLPLADMLRATKPLKMAIDATTPLLKTPAELALNRNFFFNKPIEKFRGQEKQFEVPGTDLEFGIPAKAAYLAEQATGQIGRGFSQYLQKESDQDIKFRMPSMGISSLLKDYDVKKSRYFELLNELQALQDQMKYIEQQTGQKPKTIKELKK